MHSLCYVKSHACVVMYNTLTDTALPSAL